jgi:hypothetical protein
MKKCITALLVSVSVAALLAAGALAAPAQAKSFIITRTPFAAELQQAAKAALSNFYQREQNFLTLQANYIKRAGDVAVTTQNLIDAAKAEGEDTSALESALAEFKTDVAHAQSANTSAAGTLIVHNGFDGAGKVTDIQAAYQTDLDARLSLRSAHGLMVQAETSLRQAFNAWRQAH